MNDDKRRNRRRQQTTSSSGRKSHVLAQLALEHRAAQEVPPESRAPLPPVEQQPAPADPQPEPVPAPATPSKADAYVVPPLPDNKLIADIIVKTKTSLEESANNRSGVIATARMVQVINFLILNARKSQKEKFIAIRTFLGTPDMRDFRQDLGDYAKRLAGPETADLNAAANYFLANILTLRTPKIQDEDAKKYWPIFYQVITDIIGECLSEAAYRYGNNEVSADIKFARLANEICSFSSAHAKGNPCPELRSALEPFRLGLTQGSDGRDIMAKAIMGGTTRSVTGVGTDNAVSVGSMGLGHSVTKSRYGWLAVSAAALVIVGGVVALNKNIREKIFGAPKPAPVPALSTPAATPKKNEAPKAILISPLPAMIVPKAEPLPSLEVKPTPPAPVMIEPKDHKVWKFPLETKKGTPEYVAMHVKRAIADKLLTKYAQYEDAKNILEWMIGQFGGEQDNKLKMDCFNKKITFIRPDGSKLPPKSHAELDNSDKARLSFALFAKLYGIFLQDTARQDIDKASAEILANMPAEIRPGLGDLIRGYAKLVEDGTDLQFYLEYQAKKPSKDSDGNNVRKMTVDQKDPILQLEYSLIKIHTADLGNMNSRIWGAFMRQGWGKAA